MNNKEYTTKQRQIILNCLLKNKENHFTADGIVEILRKSGKEVGKTTIYRYLEKLEKEGRVRKYLYGDNSSACYQYISEQDECQSHHHLKCTQCGKLIHLECDFLNELSEHIYIEHKFKIDSSKVILYGICEDCNNEKNN